MKKKRDKVLLISICVFLVVIANVMALNQLEVNERNSKLNFGHVLQIKNIETEPENLAPGQVGVLKITLQNTASFSILDIRTKLQLPAEFSFFNDVSERKIPELTSDQVGLIDYNIIALPGSSEGVYNADLVIDYLNKIGNERQDNNTLGIIIKSEPKIFAKIDSTEIYQGNEIGEISINFINNDLGDIKFLTVELLESEDYKIISSNKEYIGDLDSDDFESVDFRLKVESRKKQIDLPLKIDYRDALNNPYSQELSVVFNKNTSAELGIDTGSKTGIILAVVLVGVLGWLYYKRRKKKKKKEVRS
tara:strand:- start:1895 stop:2812 length:918 start_codon:yes stop_codon:yes gene_type:complete